MANLFKVAKEKGATASPKSTKLEVTIKDSTFHMNLNRLAEINQRMDELMAESKVLTEEVKNRSIDEFTSIYEKSGKYPGSFNIRAEGLKAARPSSLMFIPTDKYIKITEERYNELRDSYGEELVQESTTYTMDATLIEKYGDILSDLIEKAKGIAKEDKEKLIQASTSFAIRKGTISVLKEKFGDHTVGEMLNEIKPVYQMKNIKSE